MELERDLKERTAEKERTNEVRDGGRDPGVRRPGAGLSQSSASCVCVALFYIKPMESSWKRRQGFFCFGFESTAQPYSAWLEGTPTISIILMFWVGQLCISGPF